MIDFTHNPIIPADYKSRGRGLPYEASPFGVLFVLQWSGLEKAGSPQANSNSPVNYLKGRGRVHFVLFCTHRRVR